MDNINLKIIEKLRVDARTPFLQIAKQLEVSEGTIRKRVKDLIQDKEIKKFTIETKKDTFAIVGIETETKTETKKIAERIKSYGVNTLYEVTGRFDIICMVPSAEREDVNSMLEHIRTIPGVLHTETFTVLAKD
jgi:Lrp/AsnC family transcriptional regulator, involved in the regulation of lysine biosynthesis